MLLPDDDAAATGVLSSPPLLEAGASLQVRIQRLYLLLVYTQSVISVFQAIWLVHCLGALFPPAWGVIQTKQNGRRKLAFRDVNRMDLEWFSSANVEIERFRDHFAARQTFSHDSPRFEGIMVYYDNNTDKKE